MTRNLDETFVQGEVVSNRILPTLLVVAIKWEVLKKELSEDI